MANFAEVERPDVKVKSGELELAVRLIEDLAQAEFRPAQYADEYRERVRAAVERKRTGGTIEAMEPQTPPPTVDLVATLKKSLRRGGRSRRRNAREPGKRASGRAQTAAPRVLVQVAGDDSFLTIVCLNTHLMEAPQC